MRTKITLTATVVLFMFFACDKKELEVKNLVPLDDSPIFMELPGAANGRKAAAGNGSNYQLYMAEYITASESGQIGRQVYFMNVGNKQLSADFVPGLQPDGTDNVSYYIDQNRPSNDLPVQVSTAAIARAMQTWDGVTCSELGMYNIPFNEQITTGFVSFLYGFGGSMEYVADVVHCGWLPGGFFNLLGPNGANNILGVTFTIIFTDDNGNPIDLDNNKKADVAFREIYYNDAFPWADGAHYDIETIALHEAGHGLSQGHFGTAFLDAGANKLHFSPRAVMNAAYSGIQTSIMQTDNAGHCSNWSAWPRN